MNEVRKTRRTDTPAGTPAEVPPRDGYLSAVLDWQSAAWELTMSMQRNQFQAWTDWQKSIAAVQQDLWDRWTCRFGGGVPLDG